MTCPIYDRLVHESRRFAQQLWVFLDSLPQAHLLGQTEDNVAMIHFRDDLRQMNGSSFRLTSQTRGANSRLAGERDPMAYVAGVTTKQGYAEAPARGYPIPTASKVQKGVLGLVPQLPVGFTIVTVVSRN
jgi:hypothetical protein